MSIKTCLTKPYSRQFLVKQVIDNTLECKDKHFFFVQWYIVQQRKVHNSLSAHFSITYCYNSFHTTKETSFT